MEEVIVRGEPIFIEEQMLEELREVLKTFSLGDGLTKNKISFCPIQKACKTTNPRTLVAYLLFLLQNDILNYSYEQDYSYLHPIFPCIGLLLKGHKIPRDFVASEILTVKEVIINELRQKPGEIKKNHPNYLLLKELISNLDGLQLVFLTELHEAYHGDKYPIVQYLFFKKKNFAYIKTAIEQIPYLVTMMDQNGVSLLDHVIDHYLNALNNYATKRTVCELQTITYYDQLATLLLDGTPLKSENYQKLRGLQLQKLKSFSKGLKEKQYPKEVSDRLITSIDMMYEKLVSDKIPQLSYAELCYQYDIHVDFPTNVEREVRKYDRPIDINGVSKRRFVSEQEETILTIDGTNAMELDDGISIRTLENGNYLLGIHIADPLGYLPMFGTVLTEAEKRGTSLYLKDHKISMMPPQLSLQRMSLKAGRFRYAKSFYIELTPFGQTDLDHFFLERTLIQVHDNLSYKRANEVLMRGQSTDSKIEHSLELLSMVMPHVQRNMAVSDLYSQLVDSDSTSEPLQSMSITPSEQIVATSMLLVNQIVALTFAKKGLPFLYRNHEMSQEDILRLKRLEKNLNPNSASWNQSIHKIENLFEYSYYGTVNQGHWALGFEAYSHVSSPLRRYADILASYSIDQLLFNPISDQKIQQVEKTLVKSCRRLNSRMVLVQDFTEQLSK